MNGIFSDLEKITVNTRAWRLMQYAACKSTNAFIELHMKAYLQHHQTAHIVL